MASGDRLSIAQFFFTQCTGHFVHPLGLRLLMRWEKDNLGGDFDMRWDSISSESGCGTQLVVSFRRELISCAA
jgi:hypothetical protein